MRTDARPVETTAPPRAGRALVWANVALLAMLVLHDLDHLRQGRSIEAPVVAIGIFGDVAALTSLGLAIARHRLAPLAGALVGFGTAAGFLLVHLVPDWGPLSQGYPGLGVDTISWLAADLPVIVATILGMTALRELRAARAAPG